MTTLTNGYATSTYMTAQAQSLSPVQVMLQLYDFGIAGCVAGDSRKASAALVELIAALNFDYEPIASGLYRLFEYALREVKAQRFGAAERILSELRTTWQAALAHPVPAEG